VLISGGWVKISTVIPKAQVSYTGFEDNPLCGDVKLAHKEAQHQTGFRDQ